MVLVMLYLVDYHQGILFLTSNHIDSLDQIQIALVMQYKELDLEGRAKVWGTLLVNFR